MVFSILWRYLGVKYCAYGAMSGRSLHVHKGFTAFYFDCRGLYIYLQDSLTVFE